jgi:heterodisulfide reductase subunit C2
MAEETDLRPHDILRLVQQNQRARLFDSAAPWLCLSCETCSLRCPNQVEPARIIDALRELILTESGQSLPRRVRAFHQAFLGQIRNSGRVSEVRMVAAYKLASGALLDDVLQAPAMFVRGKLPLLHKKHGVADVRRIFAACEAARKRER